jgi:hypothetical protein
MYDKDFKGAFSNEGFRVRRLNPDNSYPDVSNHLGFLGTIDTTELLGTEKLSYRWNGTGDFSDLVIDLKDTGLVKTAATVAEVVTALNLIETFSPVFTASADTVTGRLKIADAAIGEETESTYSYLELKGEIAILLGFGASGDAPAMGTAFVNCFDDSGAIGFPKNIKDFEEIEKESGDGSVDTMIMDAQLKGLNPTIALTDEVYELKVMIQGGSWDNVTNTYTPPTTEQAVLPYVACEAFVAKYGKGTSHRGDLTGYKMYDIKRMVGRESDVTHEIKAWASYQFDCRVMDYMENDVRMPGWTERELTISQFVSLGLV